MPPPPGKQGEKGGQSKTQPKDLSVKSTISKAVTRKEELSVADQRRDAKKGERASPAGDEAGRGFWGPNGIMTEPLASFRAAVEGLRALIARQAAAILRLPNHLANPGT